MKFLLTTLFALTVVFASAQFNYEAPTETQTEVVSDFNSFQPTSFDVSLDTPTFAPEYMVLSDADGSTGLSKGAKIRIGSGVSMGLGLILIGVGTSMRTKAATQGNVLVNAVNGDFQRADNTKAIGHTLFWGGASAFALSFTF